MPKDNPWPTIHAERAALADYLTGVADERWSTPSQCGGWSVRQVLAHMTAAAVQTPPTFFAKMLAAGLRFEKMAAKDVDRNLGAGPSETLARFSANARKTSAPPGPKVTWL